MPLLTLPFVASAGYGDHAATVVDAGDGRIYVFWIQGGTLKGSLHRTSDRTTIAGPWDTNLTGLQPGTRIDADEIALGGNRVGIVLILASGVDPIVTYRSADGRAFS